MYIFFEKRGYISKVRHIRKSLEESSILIGYCYIGSINKSYRGIEHVKTHIKDVI